MSQTAPISRDPLARLAERQTWIPADTEIAVQHAVRDAFKPLGTAAKPVRNALHGTFLHEPLHAIMTDVPVGAWTSATLFDGLAAAWPTDSGARKLNTAADASVLLGLAGAVGAAITGLNDWAEIKDAAPRKIGAVHGLLNIVTTGLFVASALARRKPAQRLNARLLGLAGTIVLAASAHLGGNLVYEHSIGIRGNQQES